MVPIQTTKVLLRQGLIKQRLEDDEGLVDRVVARAWELMGQDEDEDEEEENPVSLEMFKRLEREVDRLESKVVMYRRTVPQEARLFFQRRQDEIVEVRSKVSLPQPPPTTLAMAMGEDSQKALEVSKRVELLFANIQETLPGVLDRAETNLAALHGAKLHEHKDEEIGHRALSKPSPDLEAGRLLAEAIANGNRKRSKH
ncbi:hypothetical protein BASA81_008537 [Batrachochytrium salamandrivorans]|nr:hypothetical protein BASA81_008537 [Batrachochytrium salamandrivorans]